MIDKHGRPQANLTSRHVTVAIPTFNNEEQLVATIASLVQQTDFQGRILVINNGKTKYEDIQEVIPYEVDWIYSGENLGWQRSINLALKHTKTELFCMSNDDLHFPLDRNFWEKITSWFGYDNTGGVGPCSNYAFGYQNMFTGGLPDMFRCGILIGYFAIYRTEVLTGLGGLDEDLPGGDDFDLSIRMVMADWKLVVDRRCFVYHHGSQTGRRIYGKYWDSKEHQLATYNYLIKKHGLKTWFGCTNQKIHALDETYRFVDVETSYERAVVKPSDIFQLLPTLKTFASGCDHITEFGTNDGTSATAFLAAHPKRFVTYDIERHEEVEDLYRLSALNGTKFDFVQQDVLEADIEPTDLLFVDDLHTYDQVKAELARHHEKVGKYILFHDTETLATSGENGDRFGIRPAIEEFLKLHDNWRIVTMLHNNNGLMALARVA